MGALVTALGSAASWFCCLPFALGALGTGTVAFANVVGFWRPYLMGLAVLLLGFAFYRAYRPVEVTCDATGTCPRGRRRQRLWLWLGVAASGVLLTVPYWGHWLIYWTL